MWLIKEVGDDDENNGRKRDTTKDTKKRRKKERDQERNQEKKKLIKTELVN